MMSPKQNVRFVCKAVKTAVVTCLSMLHLEGVDCTLLRKGVKNDCPKPGSGLEGQST